MKTLAFLLCLIIFAGCATTQETELIDQPQLLQMSTLPEIPNSIYSDNFKLDVQMCILDDGSVAKVKMLAGSGDLHWDSLAIQSISLWKFSPATFNGKPVATLIRRHINVQFDDPVYMILAEIKCNCKDKADSLYQVLKKGADFGTLAEKHSLSNSSAKKGFIGEVNINCFAEKIREELTKLKDNEFSEPILFGFNYVIFKKISY